jgi:hypothetical protein
MVATSMIKLTKHRRDVLAKIHTGTAEHPVELHGVDLRAATWLSEHGLAGSTGSSFYPIGPMPAGGPVKPRVRALDGDLDGGPWEVDFGTAVGVVALTDLGAVVWTLRVGEGQVDAGHCSTLRYALLELSCAHARLHAPPSFAAPPVPSPTRRMSRRSSNSFRQLLRDRTGITWSVRRSRRNRDTLIISSVPSRRVDGGMSVQDAALLAAVTGRRVVTPHSGVEVEPHQRESIISAIAGPAKTIGREVCA